MNMLVVAKMIKIKILRPVTSEILSVILKCISAEAIKVVSIPGTKEACL